MTIYPMDEWPFGGSATASHVLARDWAATPLGPMDGWPPSLRTMVGLVLGSQVPMSLLWGRQATQIYNDAYAQVIGERHPDALGRSALETFAEVRPIFEPQIERVWAGASVVEQDQYYPFIRRRELEDAWFSVSHNPVRDESGTVAGVLTIFTETTARVLAERQRTLDEASQREAAVRQAFLVGLSDMLRSVADPIAQQEAACRMLGEQLGASRVMYAEVEPDGRTLYVHSDYCRPGVFSVAGTHNLEDFGLGIAEPLRAGQRVIVEDYQALPGITAEERAAYEAVGLVAFVADPLVNGGQLTALISVHHAAPHAWSPLEIALIRETIERTRESVERARAEAALRDREAQLRLALDIAGLGIWAWDLATGSGYLDARSAEIIGLDPGSVTNVAAAQFESIHPEDFADVQEQVQAGLASGESFDLTYRVVLPDGTIHYVASRARAFLDEAGRPIRLVGTNRDVTAERVAVARLRASEERQAFLLDLSDRLRPLADPVAIQYEAVRVLGERLRANRVGYAEVQPDGETIMVNRHYLNGMPAVEGPYRLDTYERELLATLRAGRTVARSGVDPAPTDEQTAADDPAGHPGAVANVPLVKAGRLLATLFVHHRATHNWTPEELTLIEETAERTWAALERARAEQALRESEQRFRTMADAVPQIIWITDPEGRAEFFNKQWSNYTGVPYEPTTAAEVAAHFLHPADGAPTMQAFNEARRTGSTFMIEHRIRSAAGEYRWFLVRAEPYRDQQTGEITRWFGASIDIHDRKQVEEALRTSEGRYRTLFDSIDEGFCIIRMIFDEDGAPVDYRFLTSNPAFERQTGLRAALGRTVREILPDIESHWLVTYGAVALTGEPIRFVDHSPLMGRWFDVYAFRVDAAEERKVALLFTDITERKRAEVALRDALAAEQAARAETEAALRAREQFLSIASHELRTPLTSLLGSADLLRRNVARGQPIPERTLERIVRQAQRMDRLISQLLDVSRLQLGQFALERQPLDLAALTDHVVDEFRAALPPTGAHTLDVRLPEAPVVLMGDAQRLEQVLENLLSNAVKYSPGGGPVRVRVSSSDGAAVIEVSDAGIGIPPAAQEQVFAPFYRAPNVGAQASGFGIGLYVVAEIIRRHDGRIALESQEGMGSTFRVTLPLHPEA